MEDRNSSFFSGEVCIFMYARRTCCNKHGVQSKIFLRKKKLYGKLSYLLLWLVSSFFLSNLHFFFLSENIFYFCFILLFSLFSTALRCSSLLELENA